MKTKVLKLKKFKIAKLNTTRHIIGGNVTNGPACRLRTKLIICPRTDTTGTQISIETCLTDDECIGNSH